MGRTRTTCTGLAGLIDRFRGTRPNCPPLESPHPQSSVCSHSVFGNRKTWLALPRFKVYEGERTKSLFVYLQCICFQCSEWYLSLLAQTLVLDSGWPVVRCGHCRWCPLCIDPSRPECTRHCPNRKVPIGKWSVVHRDNVVHSPVSIQFRLSVRWRIDRSQRTDTPDGSPGRFRMPTAGVDTYGLNLASRTWEGGK